MWWGFLKLSEGGGGMAKNRRSGMRKSVNTAFEMLRREGRKMVGLVNFQAMEAC